MSFRPQKQPPKSIHIPIFVTLHWPSANPGRSGSLTWDVHQTIKHRPVIALLTSKGKECTMRLPGIYIVVVFSPLDPGERGLGDFPWRHHTNVTFYSLSTECTATRFVYRNPVTCSVPLEGRDELEHCREIKLAACSRSYGAPTRVWGRFRT